MSKIKDAMKYATLKCPKCGGYHVSEKSGNMFLELRCEDCEYTCTWTGNLSEEIIGPTHNAWIEHDWHTFGEVVVDLWKDAEIPEVHTHIVTENCPLCGLPVEGEVEGLFYHFLCNHCNTEWYKSINDEGCCSGGCCDIHLPDEDNTEAGVETEQICAPTQEWYEDQIHKLTKELIDKDIIIEALIEILSNK